MSKRDTFRVPIWFWMIAIFSLIWNLTAIGAFVGQMSFSQTSLLAFPVPEQELLKEYPTWLEVVYAVVVFAGILGSLGLLLRKKWAKPLFILSLVAIVVQMSYNLISITSLENFSPEAVILPIFIMFSGLFYVFFSNYSIKRNWLE
ncbi:hypothetical protein [Joostella sp.]|uniref:hypothetical protein n=1 Tax=Joostella sp. TaxID=2231138 RepID=UPI003A922AB4